MAKVIYLDNGNVTRVSDRVFEAMKERYLVNYGVPGGEFGHFMEEEAGEAIWKAREVIAAKIGARPEEIVFTSGVTEGNNLAVKGAVGYMEKKGGKQKILTSAIERKCVMNSVKYLEGRGHEALKVGVDSEGFIDMEELKESAKGASFLSIQHANQEIGTVQDTKAVGDIAEDAGAIFHTDASHSFLRERIDVRRLNVDMLTISGHLIHAPLGSGALFVREGLKLEPILHGDQREFGLRAGNPNMPAIIGLAEAVKEARDDDVERMRGIRDRLTDALLEIPDSELNGPRKGRVADNVNVSFRGVEGEAVLMLASEMGLIIRTGSACFSPELKYSYVISAIGKGAEEANSSTRFGLSRYNTMDEMERAADIMGAVVEKLRKISPLYRNRRN